MTQIAEEETVIELRARHSGRLLAKIRERRWLEIKSHGRFETFDLAALLARPQHRRLPPAGETAPQ